MDGHHILEQRDARSADSGAAVGQVGDLAELLDLKLALFRSSLRTRWGDWFVATPDRLHRLDAELSELAQLVEEIEPRCGVPPERLQR